MNPKKSGAKSRADDKPHGSTVAAPPKPRANRRRLKRRATDPVPPADVPLEAAVGRTTPAKAKRKATDARRGYDPYDSGELIKPKNPGVPRDLRSLGSWLKSRKKNRQ